MSDPRESASDEAESNQREPTHFEDVLAGMVGRGTSSDPYVVTTVRELAAIRADLSAHYTLGTDIDASATAAWNDGQGFLPIGTYDEPFTGVLDGNGHDVTGLVIDHPKRRYVGLIGFNTGTVSNLALTGTVTGDNTVGGCLGKNDGTVRAVTTDIEVRGDTAGGIIGSNGEEGRVLTASAAGTVTGKEHVGGLVGSNKGRISDATASGDVSGRESVGGLVGFDWETVVDTTASGDVSGARRFVGGLVGESRGELRDSEAHGAVECDGDFVGGLVGVIKGGTVKNVTAHGTVTGVDSVGGLVGGASDAGAFGGLADNRGGAVFASTAHGTVRGERLVGGLIGETNCVVRDATATGTTAGSEHVGGLVGLARFDSELRNCSVSGDVSADQGPVGGLAGCCRGTIKQSDTAGDSSGYETVGGLAGRHSGTITNSTARGEVSGHDYVGSLVGALIARGTIEDTTVCRDGQRDHDPTDRIGIVDRNDGKPAQEISWLTNILVESGLAAPEAIAGCSETEITQLEDKYCLDLPEIYREFLRQLGRACGDFLAGCDLYRGLADRTESVKQCIDNWDVAFTWNESDFAFMDIQSVNYFYFNTQESDPAVFVYNEGDDEPTRLRDSFSEWLLATIDQHAATNYEIDAIAG